MTLLAPLGAVALGPLPYSAWAWEVGGGPLQRLFVEFSPRGHRKLAARVNPHAYGPHEWWAWAAPYDDIESDPPPGMREGSGTAASLDEARAAADAWLREHGVVDAR